MRDPTRGVREQFGASAAAYATSVVHARGEDLRLLVRLAAPRGDERLVDLATGAGHTLKALAPKVAWPIGLDATLEMLVVARKLLADAGVADARFVQADAAAIPLPSGWADLATCRLGAHHFADPRLAFREAARVLRPGGSLFLVDNYAPDDAALDEFINALDALHDATHVRQYRVGEWLDLLARAGLRAEVAERAETELDVEDWLARSRTPPDRAARARGMLARASDAARREFAIRADRFALHKVVIRAWKP